MQLEDLGLFAKLSASLSAAALVTCLRHVGDFVAAPGHQEALWWYPDHGLQHNLRVAALCDELLVNVDLSAEEIFSVLAACLLHDVGMFDVAAARSAPEDIDSEGYAVIRDGHATASANAILNPWREDPVACSVVVPKQCFPDHNFARVVADIVVAHRAPGFREILQRQEQPEPGATAVRVPLLGACVLLADEMDLHNSRAADQIAGYWAPVTRLHHRRHHYVDSSHFVHEDGEVSMRIRFVMPTTQDDWAADTALWTGRKLASQARLVESVLAREGVRIDVLPRITVQIDTSGCKKRMPADEAAILERELVTQAIPNYHPQLATIEHFFDTKVHFEVLCPWDTLRQDLIKYLAACAEARGASFVTMFVGAGGDSLLAVASASEANQALEAACRAAEPSVHGIDGGSLEQLLSSRQWILCVVGLDTAPRDVAEWFATSMLTLASGLDLTLASVASRQFSAAPVERLETEALDGDTWRDYGLKWGLSSQQLAQAESVWSSAATYSHDVRISSLRVLGVGSSGVLEGADG